MKTIETASELYREIKNRGLHLRRQNGRDNVLLDELILKLHCPNKRLQSFLDSSGISAEDFLKVFLETTEPFAKMFIEIWEYLHLNCASKAFETVSIRFGFSDRNDKCTINLEQFRRYVETGKKIISPVRYRIWPLEALNQLFKLGVILSPDNNSLRKYYENVGRYRPGKPYKLPKIATGSHQFDQILNNIQGIFQKIIDEYTRIKEEDNHNIPELQDSNKENEDLIALKQAAYLLTDLLPQWYGIFVVYPSIAQELKDEGYKYFKKNIEPILKSESTLRLVPLLEALDILDLPFWRHRWHTYEIWAGVLTLKTIDDFQPELVVVDGHLPLDGYSGAIIAYLKSANFEKACVAVQVQTDFIRGKRKAIKPDLRICFSDDLLPDQTAVVVEFKQRTNLDRNYLEVLFKDYSDGTPNNRGVTILNYDITRVRATLPPNCFLFEGIQPCNLGIIEDFTICMREIMKRTGIAPVLNNILLLDVSISMGGSYESKIVQQALRTASKMKRIKILRFNNGLVAGGDLDESDLLSLTTSGGTELGKAIKDIERMFGLPDKILIVTDGGHEKPKEILSQIPFVKECLPEELENDLIWLR
jgi:hypothetical protein